jgi:hypothetical protein
VRLPTGRTADGDRRSLRFRLGENIFSMEGIHLDVHYGSQDIFGVLRSCCACEPSTSLWPVLLRTVVGCSTVFSACSYVYGTLRLNGRDLLFDSGTGYIEGTGAVLPKRYIWTQCSFEALSMLSVADILSWAELYGHRGFVY